MLESKIIHSDLLNHCTNLIQVLPIKILKKEDKIIFKKLGIKFINLFEFVCTGLGE